MLQLYPNPSTGQSPHHIISYIPYGVPSRVPFPVLVTYGPTSNLNAPVIHLPTAYHFMSIFSTVFVFNFLENEKRNGNVHGHIVRVNEAHQQIRREDPDEVPLEEQITTVNEGRPLTRTSMLTNRRISILKFSLTQ